MAKALPAIELRLPGSRASRGPDGWFVTLTPADLEQVPPAVIAKHYAKADREPNHEVEIVVLLDNSPVPKGEDLRIEWPNNSAFGDKAGFDAGRLVLKRPPLFGGKEPGVHKVHSRTMRSVHEKGKPLAPTLSDQLLFDRRPFPGAVPRKLQDAIGQAHRASRAFVFDRGASYRVGELCAYTPELVADGQEFARCPYPRTWVEVDAPALYDALEEAGQAVARLPDSPQDERLGFLYTDKAIYMAAGHYQEDGLFTASWSPIFYRWHQAMTPLQERRFVEEFGASRMQIDQFMWGSSYDVLDPVRRRSLRAMHGLDLMFPEGWYDAARNPHPLAQMLYAAGAGDLRLALCVALLMIRPNMTVLKETRESFRKLVLGKPTTFLAHRVVTVKLSADRLAARVRRACKEERGRARARWHEVRGHYMHNHRAKVSGCIHDWREVEPDKWECHKGCGGRRAWRTYPQGRGDANVGVVTKHYEVKP